MPSQTAANRKLIADLRKLAARIRAEADQCERAAAALEQGLAAGQPASGGSGRGRSAATSNGVAKASQSKRTAAGTTAKAKKTAAAKTPRASTSRRGSGRLPTARQTAIVGLLDADPTRVWTPREIAAETDLNASSVRTFLQMLLGQKAIARVGTGRYQSVAGATKRRGRPARAAS